MNSTTKSQLLPSSNCSPLQIGSNCWRISSGALCQRANASSWFSASIGITTDSPDIKLIRTPTLVIWGAKDTWIPLKHGHQFQRDIPNAKLVIYDDLGHIPMEEDLKRTAADARHFLTR